MARLYRISVWLSITVGVLAIIAALAAGIITGIQTPPGDPYSGGAFGGSLIIIAVFVTHLGIAPGLLAWSDLATRPLARTALRICFVPIPLTPLVWILTASIARLTGHA